MEMNTKPVRKMHGHFSAELAAVMFPIPIYGFTHNFIDIIRVPTCRYEIDVCGWQKIGLSAA